MENEEIKEEKKETPVQKIVKAYEDYEQKTELKKKRSKDRRKNDKMPNPMLIA